jgi:hypothetical protein
MKARSKNKKERDYDAKILEQATEKFLVAASKFANEFSEMEGEIFYSTFQKFNDSHWAYSNMKDMSDMDKVGDEWDYSKGITGIYRYRNI